jgi:thioredoxin-related protein
MIQNKSGSILLLFILILLLSCKSNETYEPVDEFDPERNAAQDIENAIDYAQDTNKRIILDVGGEWCIWCHRLDDFIESHPEVNNYLHENFVVVKVNYSEENKNEEVLSRYPEIPGYPHFFVLESNGDFLHSQGTAELEEDSSYSKKKLLTFLRRWAPEE